MDNFKKLKLVSVKFDQLQKTEKRNYLTIKHTFQDWKTVARISIFTLQSNSENITELHDYKSIIEL